MIMYQTKFVHQVNSKIQKCYLCTYKYKHTYVKKIRSTLLDSFGKIGSLHMFAPQFVAWEVANWLHGIRYFESSQFPRFIILENDKNATKSYRVFHYYEN